MKQCSKCKEFKDESEFYTWTQLNNRIYPHCKKCHISVTCTRRKERRKIDPELRARLTAYTYKSATCRIIRDHHKNMHDDPDHLTTTFIQKIIGRECQQDKWKETVSRK